MRLLVLEKSKDIFQQKSGGSYIFDFDKYFKNYVYEPIDLCAIYEPMIFPPAGLWDGPSNPFCDVVERKIGNTRYIIKTECGGSEPLANKIKRLIFSEKGTIS